MTVLSATKHRTIDTWAIAVRRSHYIITDGDVGLVDIAQEIVTVVEVTFFFSDAGVDHTLRGTKHMAVLDTVGTDDAAVDPDMGTTAIQRIGDIGISTVGAVFAIENIVAFTHRGHVTAAVHIVQNLAVVDGNARVAKHLTSNNVTNHGGIGLIRNGIQKYILVFGRTITSTEHRTYDKAT